MQDDPARRVQRGDVNYSDFETSIFDPKQRRAGPVQPSPKFHHDTTSRSDRNIGAGEWIKCSVTRCWSKMLAKK